jgi:16S rRNA processing protein RimM
MNPQFIPIARVVAPWGIHGEVKAESLTDFSDRFACGETVYLQGRAVTIESSRYRGNIVVLKLDAIDSRNAAELIRGAYLEIPSTELKPLPKGEYYRFQLLGLEVQSAEGKILGHISDIIPTGSNDVYEISSDTGVFLIPATDEVVKSIDLAKSCMIIELLKGLI